jgi:hypothetical protein
MDQLRERLDALESQVHTLTQHTHTATRRLRWWRGLAVGLLVLAVLTWALPASKAADAPPGLLADRMTALQNALSVLQDKLQHVTVVVTQDALPEVVITGANLRIVNGLGGTETTNSLGNLIVGYNEPRGEDEGENIRTGSHNVVVGQRHNFSRFGGLVVGDFSEISGDFAVVSGGFGSRASGRFATVSGGFGNRASGETAVVSGGRFNTASGVFAAVSGGFGNTASGDFAVVSGGDVNMASGESAVVSGGENNTASFDSAVVSGGRDNTASGLSAVVSGGLNRTAAGEFNWVAGPLFADE